MAKKPISQSTVYDDNNAKKSDGVGVKLMGDRSLLFGDGTRYRFRKIDGERWVEILNSDYTVLMHIRRDYVVHIGGPIYLFRDKEW